MPTKLEQAQRNCFGGRPVPKSLETLWQAGKRGQDFLEQVPRMRLMSSLRPLDDGYADDGHDPDVGANIRAHRRVFERLSFFAEVDGSGFLAFDRESVGDEPPVIELDSEGQYEWVGGDLVEAIRRKSEDYDLAAGAEAQLRDLGLATPPLLGLGATTQFLPSLRDWHAEFYAQEKGQQPERRPTRGEPPRASDPTSWVLAAGSAVRPALLQLLGGPPREEWVTCDGAGRVTTVWLPTDSEKPRLTVRGIGLGTKVSEVERELGKATKSSKARTGRKPPETQWVQYDMPEYALHLEHRADQVTRITLMAPG